MVVNFAIAGLYLFSSLAFAQLESTEYKAANILSQCHWFRTSNVGECLNNKARESGDQMIQGVVTACHGFWSLADGKERDFNVHREEISCIKVNLEKLKTGHINFWTTKSEKIQFFEDLCDFAMNRINSTFFSSYLDSQYEYYESFVVRNITACEQTVLTQFGVKKKWLSESKKNYWESNERISDVQRVTSGIKDISLR